ncbi:hypothetical protein [Nocardioides sp. URHA0032]|uniref:hypothetical protein n=1 Tax=Nocardioides sp. URHA0032 TaxID=1380388 RepID=UPI00048E0A93|nr:hypothetical protein [Nocardioides sp. URHA0032]
MTAEVIPLRPELVLQQDDRLSFADRVLNRLDALVALSPIVVTRRSSIGKAEMNAFTLGRESAKGLYR